MEIFTKKNQAKLHFDSCKLSVFIFFYVLCCHFINISYFNLGNKKQKTEEKLPARVSIFINKAALHFAV